MTAKEKAEKLCYDIALELPPRNGYIYAKQCALIAVDEIDDIYQKLTPKDDPYCFLLELEYWQEVKKQIQKL